MIKTLRYAFVAALMMVAGAVNAQTAKAGKTEKITIDFYDYYKDFDKEGDKKDVVYLNKFSSETKKIVSIKLIGTNSTGWGEISASSGKITEQGTAVNPKVSPLWNCDDAKTGVSDVTFTISRLNNDIKATQVRYVKAVVTVLTDATGINNITVDNAKKGVRYNLAGQRVNESYKGVVIENGKKMIVK